MKISKEQISNVEKGDTVVLLNRIYDVEENDPSKSILLLKKHGIVNIENLPKDLAADFLIEFKYKGFKNKKYFLFHFVTRLINDSICEI